MNNLKRAYRNSTRRKVGEKVTRIEDGQPAETKPVYLRTKPTISFREFVKDLARRGDPGAQGWLFRKHGKADLHPKAAATWLQWHIA